MVATVVGDAFIDLIVPTQDIKPGETYHSNILVTCGGTANVAVQVSKLGEQAKFIGKVGNDALGRYFREELERSGVKGVTFIDNEYPTGLCLALLFSSGERSMVASRGANNFLSEREIRSCISEILDSSIVYFSGYSLLSKVSSNSTLYALRECHKHDCQVWFNPGAPNLITEDFVQLIRKFVDVLVLNIEEAKSLTGQGEIDDILARLGEMVDIAAVTMGGEGCILLQNGQHTRVSAEALPYVTDTTGAGDAFSAGFIVGRLRNMDMVGCAQLGHKTAANLLEERIKLLS